MQKYIVQEVIEATEVFEYEYTKKGETTPTKVVVTKMKVSQLSGLLKEAAAYFKLKPNTVVLVPVQKIQLDSEVIYTLLHYAEVDNK